MGCDSTLLTCTTGGSRYGPGPMKSTVDYVLGTTLPEPGTAIEVADGVRWIRMPLPFALDHVNLYLIDDDEGWVLIDTGIATSQTQELWKRVLDTQLDGKPNLNPDGLHTRSHAEYVEGENLVEMIQEDLVAERIAIDSYREVIEYLGNDDITTRRIIEQILAQEEEHAEDLSSLLEELKVADPKPASEVQKPRSKKK